MSHLNLSGYVGTKPVCEMLTEGASMAGPGVWMKVSLYGTDEPGRAFQVKSMWSTSAGIT